MLTLLSDVTNIVDRVTLSVLVMGNIYSLSFGAWGSAPEMTSGQLGPK